MIILKRPIITEKSMKLAQSGLYTFEVDKNATKPEIAKKVAEKFNVKVVEVNTVNVRGRVKAQRRVRKSYQQSGFKKAIVHVGKGQTIAIFETPKEEVTVTTGEGEPIRLKEKKDILGRTKVKVEKSAVGAAPTTQRKVITGK
ncbi:50S ribosomal protein L23 [Candidatus Daviesbacteria bacterium]|nr:50S ribosomal protein L23 [Candidatus Daviesbacteria bacterium]